MDSQQRIFLDFLQFCIGDVDWIPVSVKGADWRVLYAIAQKQAIVGVLFHGISQLPKELAPEPSILMKWMMMSQRIRQQNVRAFVDSERVCARFRQKGFRNCILKGQGVALLYPDPYMRTPGDIDIYLDGGRKKIMAYINNVCPNQVVRYHHVDFPVMRTEIEVHFTPSYMFFPLHNRRMQKWFGRVMDLQCSNAVSLPDGYGNLSVPTSPFNVIYILSHLYRHVFMEGIGLRQLLDYYYVLKNTEFLTKADCGVLRANTDNSADLNNGTFGIASSGEFGTNADCVDNRLLQVELKRLGLWKFAKAVMFVLHEVFGLPEDKMIAPADDVEGKFLLKEVLLGGNFGQHDERAERKMNEGKFRRYLRMSYRNLRFVKHYPTEALSEPLFRIWFWAWKKFRC